MKLVRAVRHPLWFCMALVAALGSGYKAKPAAIDIAPVSQAIHSFESLPLPAVVVKDEKGEALEEQPEVVFSVEPSGFGVISNGKFHPQRSGTGLLVAQVKDTELSVSTALDVRLLEKIELECPSNPECAFQVGNPVELQSRLLSGGKPLTVPATWTSSDPAVVKVDGPGKVQSVALGEADVQVASLNNLKATKRIHILKPTHIAVTCVESPECTVVAGERLKLSAQVFAEERVLPVKQIFWSSPSPELLTVDQQGMAEALQEGTVTVGVSGAGVQGEAKVTVRLPAARVIVSRASEEESGGSTPGKDSNADGPDIIYQELPDGSRVPTINMEKQKRAIERMGLPDPLERYQSKPDENLRKLARCTADQLRERLNSLGMTPQERAAKCDCRR